MGFPAEFVWGVAASAYQIEGGARQGGRGESIWDEFCRRPGAVFEGHSGDVACDHFHRWPEDLDLIAAMGVRHYRLSIAWPRVMPRGEGDANADGLGFYSRLIDGMLDRGITPWVTLFHWDYPQDLQARGGWLNPESPAWFARYTGAVVDALSDRVRHWITINEPQVFIKFGHGDGINAPGLRLPLDEQLRAAHHVLLAHGRSVEVIRERAKATPLVGLAMVGVTRLPASAGDVEAARLATCSVSAPDLWNNTWYLDAVVRGRYPEDGQRVYGAAAPRATGAEMAVVSRPIDFLGLNIYEGRPVRADAEGRPILVPRPPGHPMTAFHWPVEPDALYWGPRYLHERYGLPISITENGLSSMDWPALDGGVHDVQRIDFLTRYLRSLRRAVDDGVDVRGYFHWSLLDNFEWAAGYRERFGLVYVDYATLRRIPKDSARWYRRVVESNGGCL